MENFVIKGNPCEIQMQLTSMLLEDAFDRVIKSTMDRNKALIKIMTVNEGLKGVLGKMRGYISDHGGEPYKQENLNAYYDNQLNEQTK